MSELLCEVCGEEPVVGVAAVPGLPISVGYGRACINMNAHPYGLLVANTACLSGEDDMADWWLEMVHATLRHLGKTEDEFWDDVEQSRRDMDAALAAEMAADPDGPNATLDTAERF